MPTSHSRHQFQEPKPSATPHERRKFVVLVVLGCIVVFLIWIWTLPFNFRRVEEGPAGPRQFFNVLGNQVSATLQAYQTAGHETTTDAGAGDTDTAATTTTDTGNSNTDTTAPYTTTNGAATDANATDAAADTAPTQPTNQ